MAEGENGLDETPEDKSGQNQSNEVENADLSLEQLVHEASNEYEDLNKTMDEIDQWMTDIETKNDSLVSQLKELLESNKQIRAEIELEKHMSSHTIQDKSDNKGS